MRFLSSALNTAVGARGFARFVAIALIALSPAIFTANQAAAATPAEAFITANVQKGLTILNSSTPVAEKRAQFEGFLLGLTDMKRIGLFTLGQFRRGAPEPQVDAFTAAFQTYAIAVYQSAFEKYKGQSLKVTGSVSNGPGDDTVRTVMIDPTEPSGQQPLEVDFRVKSDRGPPLVVDVCVAGVWLSQSQKDQFTSFLGNNNGSIPLLTAHLTEMARKNRQP